MNACTTIDTKSLQMYYDCRRKLLEKHTRKNAFIAYEPEPVMVCGDCGGLEKGGNLP